MVVDIFATLGDIVSGFASLIVSLFTSVASIFYTPGVGDASGQLTVVGVLMLMSIGTGLVIWGIRFIRSLIRVRTK